MATKKSTAVAVLTAAFALVGCMSGSDGAAPATTAPISTNGPAVDEPTTAPPQDASELERSQQVSEFLDAVDFNAACTSSECSTAQATFSRYQDLYELAGEIPGDDVSPYLIAISEAWNTWNDCLSTADSRFERFDCAEQSDMEQAITDLYNALR